MKFGAGAKLLMLRIWRRRQTFDAQDLAPAPNFINGGGGGDVKGCMINAEVGHSASASYLLLVRRVDALFWGSTLSDLSF